MKILTLTIENFMGLLGLHQLDFGGMGLVHVAGLNHDDPGNNSNGSGKSTLLEALTWCLFGEGLPRPQGNSEQGVRADEVLNDRLNKQCRVVVELEDDQGRAIVVDRWRKWKADKGRATNGQRLSIDTEHNEALDEKETNRLICDALGITRDIWCRGVVFGQESGFNFCDATAKARQDILTTVMGLEEIDIWHERCRNEKNALTHTMSELKGQHETLVGLMELRPVDDLHRQSEQWEMEQTRRVTATKIQLSAVEARGFQMKESLAQVVIPEILPPKEWPEIVTEHRPPPSGDISVEAAELSAAQAELQRFQGSLAEAKRELDRLDALAPGASCPTCKQVIGSEHRAACLSQQHRTVAELQGSLLDCRRVVEEAATRFRGAQDRAQKERNEYQAAQAAESARVAAARKEQLDYENRRAASQRAAQAAQAEQDRLTREVQLARDEWSRTKARIEEIEAEVNPVQAQIARYEQELAKLKARVEACEAEQDQVAYKLDTAQWWDKELPRFKTWLFDSIVDTLAAEANRWLGVMSGGVIWIQISTTKQVGKRTKDELDVQIYRWNPDGTITTRPYRIWSGGEKRRVGLAVDLGLSRLMAQRASHSYDFIAMDEIDRHLDDQGRDGLRSVLDQLRQERGSVLVISHDAEFKASFDQEITVSRHKGSIQITNRKAPRAV